MRILWVTNIPPASYNATRKGGTPFGGWISSVDKLLRNSSASKRFTAFPSTKVSHGIEPYEADSDYIRFSDKRDLSQSFVEEWCELFRKFKVDVIHLFGTELPHSAVVARAAKQEKIPLIITVQGLVSYIGQHVHSGLEDIGIRDMTLRSFLMKDSIPGLRRTYASRSHHEVEALGLADYVIGRTEWDQTLTRQLAPQARYFHVDQTLRESFNSGAWEPEQCTPRRIIMSQANNPIKGLHIALHALSILKQQYPDVSLVVAGTLPYRKNLLSQRILGTQYGSAMRRLAKQLGLQDSVQFVGLTPEPEMKQLYLSANVYLSASLIENESTSLSEAMALGVPSVASYVGGVTSRIEHGVTGYLYQHDAPYMCASYISQIFDQPEEAKKMGSIAQERFRKQLGASDNLAKLLEVYQVAVGEVPTENASHALDKAV